VKEPDKSAAFDGADFYDCGDSESLRDESPEEAIEKHLEYFLTPGCDVAAVIRKHSPIKVTAYARCAVDEAWLARRLTSIEDVVAEQFSEDYGDPDGGDDGLTPDVFDAARATLRAWLVEVVGKASVWHCEEVGLREYAADEALALMREHRPEWFEAAE